MKSTTIRFPVHCIIKNASKVFIQCVSRQQLVFPFAMPTRKLLIRFGLHHGALVLLQYPVNLLPCRSTSSAIMNSVVTQLPTLGTFILLWNVVDCVGMTTSIMLVSYFRIVPVDCHDTLLLFRTTTITYCTLPISILP